MLIPRGFGVLTNYTSLPTQEAIITGPKFLVAWPLEKRASPTRPAPPVMSSLPSVNW